MSTQGNVSYGDESIPENWVMEFEEVRVDLKIKGIVYLCRVVLCYLVK